MKLFLLLGFSLLLYHEIEGITTHSITGCSDRVVLNCSFTEMIHVERITYYNETDCNQAVTDLQVCGQPVTRTDTELVPYCNGKATCEEILYYSYCPDSKAAKVDYRCIPGNDVKDMCDTFIIDNTNLTFLSTPNFPSRPIFTDISPCRCSIRGSRITSIQILELVLPTSNDGTKYSLEIKYGDVTYKIDSYRVVINKRLSAASTIAEIMFNHNNINEQYLWIEVQGIGMRVSCNTETNAKNVTSSSSPSLSSSATHPTQTPDTKYDSQNTIIILAVLLSLCFLMICIATIIIIVLVRRRNRLVKQSEVNLYLVTENDSESDGTLSDLNDSNSTKQLNNVSQNTHPEYHNLNWQCPLLGQ